VALSIGYNNDASTYAGVLSGSGSLTKFGDGTLTLAGANTYGGLTTIRSGTLTLANARTLQNSTLSMSGGNLVFDSTVGGHAFTLGGLETDVAYNFTLQDNAGNPVALSIGNNNAGTAYAGILSGAGSLTKIGSGTLTLADANTYTGDTTVSAGKLILKNPLAVQASTLRLAGGALVFDSSVSGHAFTLGGLASSYAGTSYTIALQDNALTPAAVALSIGNNDVNSLYAGALTGSGSLIKEGSGTLTLTGQSSYQGATLITQGAVIVEGGGSISKTSRVTVDSGDSATTAALTVDGLLPSSIVVLGNMTVGDAGVGTLTLRNWGTVNVGGRNGTGVLTLADHAGSVGTLNIDSGDGAGTLNAAQVTGGAGTASVNFNQTDDSYIFLPLLTGSLALNQNGSGTTVLVRSNTHAGATQVTAGSLQVANGNALQNSTLTMIGGNLIFDSAVSGHGFILGGLAGESGSLVMLQDNATTPNAVALSVGNNYSNTAYAGNLSGTGSLTKIGSGTSALNGSNNYEGFTAVTAGTLLINGSNTGTGAFNVASGATLGGTGSIAVAINVTGVLAPGASIGTLTSGALTLANHSTYQYEVDSSVSATVGADLHIVNGALNLGSSVTLNLSDLGTGNVATGTVFSLFNYSTGLWNNALFTYNSTDLTDDSTFNFLDKIWTIDYNATTKGVNVAGTESGNYVNISATDAYTLWIQTPGFAIPADKQGATADPDGDGANNLEEFAFGGIPNDPTNKGLVFGTQADPSGTGGTKQMILTIAVRNGVTFAIPASPDVSAVSDATVDGLNYTVQGSSDLTDWVAPVTPVPLVNPGLPTLPPDYHYASFVLGGSDGLPTQGFLRARVEMP
jgi:autotransporter-associated beta strand protein